MRKAVPDGKKYRDFIMKYGPKFSPTDHWKNTGTPPSALMTVEEEAFGLLVVENEITNWTSESTEDNATKPYSLSAKESCGDNARGGGWTDAAFRRYAEIVSDVQKDRTSETGKLWESQFWNGPRILLPTRNAR